MEDRGESIVSSKIESRSRKTKGWMDIGWMAGSCLMFHLVTFGSATQNLTTASNST